MILQSLELIFNRPNLSCLFDLTVLSENIFCITCLSETKTIVGTISMTEPKEHALEVDVLSAEIVASELDTLPNRLGFAENAELLESHTDIVGAVSRGSNAERILALNRYLDEAERLVDLKPDIENERARAQVGLIIAQALIWREAGEPVKHLRSLLRAQEYAVNMGFEDVLSALDAEIDANADSGELLQAQGEFDEAVGAYIEIEQADLTDNQRGVLNMRLAECYQDLLDDNPNQSYFLKELLDGSLESAILYLEGDRDQLKALAFQEGFVL